MKHLYILLFTILVSTCARERSCEDCIENEDTVYNNLITNYEIRIDDNSQAQAIYPQVRTKLYPGHYQIFETINVSDTNYYKGSFDLKKYLEMGKFFKGDSFFVRYGVRWRFKQEEYVCDTILIY